MPVRIDPNTGERIDDNAPQIDPATGERVASAQTVTSAPPKGVLSQMADNAKSNLATLPDFGKGIVKGAMNTAGGLMKLANPYGDLYGGSHPDQTLIDRSRPSNNAQAIGRGTEQAGEFLIPGLDGEALATKAAPVLGKTLARVGASALGSGAVNAAQGGSFGTGAILGGAGEGLAQGAKALSPLLAETALKVRGNDRLFGRTVGNAILDDTSGVRPETVAASAKKTISQLKPQVEQIADDAGASGSRGSLLPARQRVGSVIDAHKMNRAVVAASAVQPVADRLTTDAVTGLPLAAVQTPTGLLNMKRGLNEDFIANWNPLDNQPATRSAAKQAYGALADEFHSAAPGSQELDQRISSLVPVAKLADKQANAAGILQRGVDRLKAHTGAAALAGGAGGAYGYHEGGLPGAVLGTAGGVMGQEMLTSPELSLGLARMAYSPNVSRYLPAGIGAALQMSRKKEDQ